MQRDLRTIAALSSGSQGGAVAVIRVSGSLAWALTGPFLTTKTDHPTPRHMFRGEFQTTGTEGEVLDDVLYCFFPAPHSFTGENVVEIYCHGGPYIISEILKSLYRVGVLAAQPGEFTKRALLRGKLDMTTAEGIKDLVEAQTKQQWISGRQLYSGRLKNEIISLRASTIEAMAWLEAMIDFPDEGDTQSVALKDVYTRVNSVEIRMKALLRSYDNGHVASQGLMVCLVGAPNAGKSTLLNSLIGKQRAIVSPEAGTTRDYIEERCLIDGRLIRLVDTAGIRHTKNAIEAQGVLLSRELASQSDIILSLVASDSSPSEREEIDNVLSAYSNKNVLRILTKSDLSTPQWATNMLPISCITEHGMDQLRQTLSNAVDACLSHLDEEPFLTSTRQKECVQSAIDALEKFYAMSHNQSTQNSAHELLAFELQEVARRLSEIIGDVSNDDILDKVFRDFCIGK